jgi:hypothetical protein
MEFKDYDFIRNPVVQNEVCFLQSKCPACGFSILVSSVEELAGRAPHSAGGRIGRTDGNFGGVCPPRLNARAT